MCRPYRFMLFTLAVALVLILPGCGTTPTPATSEPPAAPTTAPAEQEVESTPTTAAGVTGAEISENVAIYAVNADMPSLDTATIYSADVIYLQNVYENLTRWEPDEGATPLLATSWERNDDATEWTFHLREGVTFHDGSAFTAEDVKASFNRVLTVGAMDYYLDGISEMIVVDDHTIQFKLSAPRNLPVLFAGVWAFPIMCAEAAVQPETWFAEGNECGTGPYMLERWEPGSRIVLTQYKDYWGGWTEGQFTRVVLEMVLDSSVREQMIRSGEAQITTGEIVVNNFVPFYMFYYHLHTDKPPLDDVRVRQALAYSFPYNDAIQGAYDGEAKLAEGAAASGTWNLAELRRPTHDLERAKALLTEAGVEEGLELFAGLVPSIQANIDATLLWQAELAKIGVTLKIEQFASAALWDHFFNPDTKFDIIAGTWGTNWPTPFDQMSLFHTDLTIIPFMAYSNPEFDEIIYEAKALEATDPAKADELYGQAQQMLYDDVPTVFAVELPINVVMRKGISGFEPEMLYGAVVRFYELRRTE